MNPFDLKIAKNRPKTSRKGVGKGSRGIGQPVASSSSNMSPWGLMATPFNPIFINFLTVSAIKVSGSTLGAIWRSNLGAIYLEAIWERSGKDLGDGFGESLLEGNISDYLRVVNFKWVLFAQSGEREDGRRGRKGNST